jgi:hypothetical protein
MSTRDTRSSSPNAGAAGCPFDAPPVHVIGRVWREVPSTRDRAIYWATKEKSTMDESTSRVIQVASGQTGRSFWGPGDMYTFLVTSDESGGSMFALDCVVGSGGGPPPHIWRRMSSSRLRREASRLRRDWTRARSRQANPFSSRAPPVIPTATRTRRPRG